MGTPEIVGLQIGDTQYTLHLYKDNGNVICYKMFEGDDLIIPEGRPQKIGHFQPEKTETEEELIQRLIEFFTEKHQRPAEAYNPARSSK